MGVHLQLSNSFEERFYATPQGIHLAKTQFDEQGKVVHKDDTEVNVTKEVFAAICFYSKLIKQESFDFADYTIIITEKRKV